MYVCVCVCVYVLNLQHNTQFENKHPRFGKDKIEWRDRDGLSYCAGRPGLTFYTRLSFNAGGPGFTICVIFRHAYFVIT